MTEKETTTVRSDRKQGREREKVDSFIVVVVAAVVVVVAAVVVVVAVRGGYEWKAGSHSGRGTSPVVGVP